jgi:glucan 1,3-beta-glucosidase
MLRSYLLYQDLHAAPGAQNNDAHAGTGTGRVEFWKRSNLRATVFCLEVLLRHLVGRPNVVGLELINEPAADPSLWSWYQSTFATLRSISPDMPLYIGDAWDPNTYTAKAGERNDHIVRTPQSDKSVISPPGSKVVDTHVYRCFTPEDHHKSGDQHASELSNGTTQWFRELSSKCRGNLIVGEFSAALNPGSYPPGCNDGEKDRQRRAFLRAELDMFEECCTGWFFWTYKKQEGWDAGWDLRNARLADIVPSLVGRRPYNGPMPNLNEREGAKNGALGMFVWFKRI